MAGAFVIPRIQVLNREIVEAKLMMAAPRINEQNRLMTEEILKYVKAETVANTPVGPGHFGYHLRERFTTDVSSRGFKTIGVLKAPATGLWRERGTRRGERAFMTAHHALAVTKKIINFYYGGLATWYRS